MITNRICLTGLLGFSSLLPMLANGSSWSFEIEPYAMSSSIDGDAGVGRVNGADVDIDMDDILETLHMAAMIHFEAHHDSGWGLALDYGFMDLRDDISGPRGGVAEVKVRQGVFMADVIYRRSVGEGTLDYLAGVRWWDNDVEVNVDLAVLPGSVQGEIKEDWVDLYIGARWQIPLSDHWSFTARGDIGGFGVEADFTSVVLIGAKYQINKKVIIDLAYKGLWVDYESGNQGERGYFAYDTLTHGPLVGLIYKF
ncbi:MAG: hypothetical protein JKY66_10860 [Spongiibacteraceae bacterium]|nr:hypothetical protein [Spongiibacteraceae bacterium]MBN4055134.1 hypothetical protein [bacterium AH-315-K03]